MLHSLDGKSRILVTRGAGFRNSHLSERLLHNVHKVICVDNLSIGCKQNVDYIYNCQLFKFIRRSVTSPVRGSPSGSTGRSSIFDSDLRNSDFA